MGGYFTLAGLGAGRQGWGRCGDVESPQTALRHYRRATLDDCRAAVLSARLGTPPEGKVIALETGAAAE